MTTKDTRAKVPQFHQSGVDYYGVLQLDQQADEATIKNAFRHLAIKYHPVRNPQHSAEDPGRYALICEAYDVLHQPELRAIYDQYGEVGIKRGVPLPNSQVSTPYVFCGHPERIFEQFFGTLSPYADLLASVEVPLSAFHAADGMHVVKQPEPLVTPLSVTLEEVLFGTLKKVRVNRRVVCADGVSTRVEQSVLTVRVPAGAAPGHQLLFPGAGDRLPHAAARDLMFVLQDAPHAHFRRVHDTCHLEYPVCVPLLHALTGCSVDVPTLDGRLLRVNIHDVIRPGFRKVVRGEGLPLPAAPDCGHLQHVPGLRPAKRGDLIIEFSVQFPRSLSRDQSHAIRAVLLSSGEKRAAAAASPLCQHD